MPDSLQKVTDKTIGELMKDSIDYGIPERIPDWCPLDEEKTELNETPYGGT